MCGCPSTPSNALICDYICFGDLDFSRDFEIIATQKTSRDQLKDRGGWKWVVFSHDQAKHADRWKEVNLANRQTKKKPDDRESKEFSEQPQRKSSFATANPIDFRCGRILARPLWRRFTSSVDIMIIYDSVLDSSLLSLAPQKSPPLAVLQISNNQWDDRHCFNKAIQLRTAYLSPVQNANLSMHVTLCRCPLLGFCTCDLYAIVWPVISRESPRLQCPLLVHQSSVICLFLR